MPGFSRPWCFVAFWFIWATTIIGVVDIPYSTYNRKFIGATDGERNGYSVSKAGDVNRDGIGDLIVGSYLADPFPNRADAGVSYVIFGNRNVNPADLDLSTIGNGTANGFRIVGAYAGDQSGYSVSDAGDFNNDGYDDVIVGAWAADSSGRSNSGAAYIIFGNSNPLSVDLRSMVSGPTTGIRILGAAVDDNCGWSVSAAGDVNSDGRKDVVIGAPLADPGSRSAAGTVYVIFGHDVTTTFIDINLLTMTSGPTVGFRINGWTAGDQTGYSVSNAGDFNKDGYGDIVISAHTGSSNKGGAFVIYGRISTNSYTDFEVSATGSGNNFGFYLVGGAANEKAGFSVSCAGDFNNDGFSDILIGAPYGDPSVRAASSDAGITYVVFGQSAVGNIPLTGLPSSQGFRIFGAAVNDYSGYSVSDVGDTNADGYTDIIIGAPAIAGTASGASYILYGHGSSFAYVNIDLLSLSGTDGVRIGNTVAAANSGFSVSGAGDINGDGGVDLIIGAYGTAYTGRGSPGVSIMFYGVASPTSQPSSHPTMQPSRQPSGRPTSQPSRQPSSQPTRQPSSRPSSQPSAQPASVPTSQPSSRPSSQPSAQPAARPTGQPTRQPSSQPSAQPAATPTSRPTSQPSSQPSRQPSAQPTTQPSFQPSRQPSAQPTGQPSTQPSAQPIGAPSSRPSGQPSARPSAQPTRQPSSQPSVQPSQQPSSQPSNQPSNQPSHQPSTQPTRQPTGQPSGAPSAQPTTQPTMQPTEQPNAIPTGQPSGQPSRQPSCQPSDQPTAQPSRQPSSQPSVQPSVQPSRQPSAQPSEQPSQQPSSQPSAIPSAQPSSQPSHQPSNDPTGQPSSQPVARPSAQPSSRPSAQPSKQPSDQPSTQPSSLPSSQPSGVPSVQPTSQPSVQPNSEPTSQPSARPSAQPTCQPSSLPSGQPSSRPTSQPNSAPSSQPSTQPTSQPTQQPTSQPSAQPSKQPYGAPTSQPSRQPVAFPTSQPSNQPSLRPSSQPTSRPSAQPSMQPSRQPSSRPTSQPSRRPSGQPSHQPSAQPSVQPSAAPTAQREWSATLQSPLVIDHALLVQRNVWGCGRSNTTNATAYCSLADEDTGGVLTTYRLPWDTVIWADAATTNPATSKLLVSGRTTTSTGITSAVATCDTQRTPFTCNVWTFSGLDLRHASLNTNTNRAVLVGRYGTYSAAVLFDAVTSAAKSYVYRTTSVASAVLLRASSIPSFFGSIVAGTAVSSAVLSSLNYIVSGWVRADTGTASMVCISPVAAVGTILNSADLVTALAIEPTGPDSFIAGGLKLSDGLDMHAYFIRTSALYHQVVYSLKYIPFVVSTRRRLTSTNVVRSVVRGIAFVDNVLYSILDTVRSRTELTVIESDSLTGAILQQVSVSAPQASLFCTDIASAGMLLAIACTVQSSTIATQSLLLGVDRKLSFVRLPTGFTVNRNATYYTETIALTMTPVVFRDAYSAPIVNSTYTFNPLDTMPSFAPSSAPQGRPTVVPSHRPSALPTSQPSSAPSTQPSSSPTSAPTVSARPTSQPSSAVPTNTHKPIAAPSVLPSRLPSTQLTSTPSALPTTASSSIATTSPTFVSSSALTISPTSRLTAAGRFPDPSAGPSAEPSAEPSAAPTSTPSDVTTTLDEVTDRDGRNASSYMVYGASIGGAVLICGAFIAWIVYKRRSNKLHDGDLLSPKDVLQSIVPTADALPHYDTSASPSPAMSHISSRKTSSVQPLFDTEIAMSTSSASSAKHSISTNSSNSTDTTSGMNNVDNVYTTVTSTNNSNTNNSNSNNNSNNNQSCGNPAINTSDRAAPEAAIVPVTLPICAAEEQNTSSQRRMYEYESASMHSSTNSLFRDIMNELDRSDSALSDIESNI